jgi:hypothetical protein
MDVDINDLARQSAQVELAQARSDFLDSFADLEAKVAGFLRLAGKLVNGEPLSARIKGFRAIDGIAAIAKANNAKRDSIADQIAELLAIRADIVHSRLVTCIIDDIPTAKLINAQSRHEKYPSCRLLSQTDLQQLRKSVETLKTQMEELGRINPAS